MSFSSGFCEKLSPPGGHLKPVCRHWEKKPDGAKNCQEQVIVQSLFAQSARTLRALHTASILYLR